MLGSFFAAPITPSFDEVLRKIESFSELEDGWDYGEGAAISEATLDVAKKWVNNIRELDFEYVNAFPGVGAVTLVGRWARHRIEIIIREPDAALRFGFAYDVDKKQVFYKSKLSETDFVSAFWNSVRNIWKVRDSLIQRNTTQIAINFQGKHFATIPEVDFQSSGLAAQNASLAQYVPTLQGTIKEKILSPESLLLIGNSIQIYFPSALQ